jgi:ribonuclease HI
VWIHKWKKNGWKLSDGVQVKYKEDLIALDEALEGMSVKWVGKTKILILSKEKLSP